MQLLRNEKAMFHVKHCHKVSLTQLEYNTSFQQSVQLVKLRACCRDILQVDFSHLCIARTLGKRKRDIAHITAERVILARQALYRSAQY